MVVKLFELAVICLQASKRDLVLCNLFLHTLYFPCFASHFQSTLFLLKRAKGVFIIQCVDSGFSIDNRQGWVPDVAMVGTIVNIKQRQNRNFNEPARVR